MRFSEKLLESPDDLAKAQTLANASRVAGEWRGLGSGVRAVVAAQGDGFALPLYRADGIVIGVAAEELGVSFARLCLIDESGKPADRPHRLLRGGSSLEIELRDARCGFRDTFRSLASRGP